MIYKYPNPMLCLSWLPKWMLDSVPVLPTILDYPNWHFPGSYVRPSEYPYLDHDCSNGIIVIGKTNYPAATLAHEFRHHWQYFNTNMDGSGSKMPMGDTWEDRIIHYYTTQPQELDALMFEHRVAPCEENEYTLSLVLEHFRA